ncbi:hypoxanthine-guanine phosphoribosyltransferase [Thiohalocapsa marina]|uniref:Hypoxanthine-guanine phosphoribosyltransferase n=1 Tax=Thiohalocapsa marina TaxID=424902 RepID=A0A5M8FP32_9GAMM|nr:hypoxanthine-guanine phosphoribosyltransferase [Thiohalocapsa marina]KAA6186244.1 hypoxanthine-guanine phosphoribosyltransferase [Thiohalocapsa marina]
MSKMTPEQFHGVRQRMDLIADQAAVERAFDDMAQAIEQRYADKDPLLLCVVTGGIVTAGLLLPRLDIQLRLDYVHASRYRGATSGGELHWRHRPSEAIQGEHVLVVDDIFDEGCTMAAIVDACVADGAASVQSVVLARKERAHATDYRPDIIGLTVPDRYVMGYGLDYKNYFRNAAGIYAAADEDV